MCQEDRGANRGCRVRWRHSSKGVGQHGDSSLQSLRILFVKEGFQEEGHVLESWKSGTSEKPSYTGHRDEGKAS